MGFFRKNTHNISQDASDLTEEIKVTAPETDDDFEQTMKIAKQIKYINSYSFKYSPKNIFSYNLLRVFVTLEGLWYVKSAISFFPNLSFVSKHILYS